MVTAVDMVRRAAAEMRAKATAATRGPWNTYPTPRSSDNPSDVAWSITRPYCDKGVGLGGCEDDCGVDLLRVGVEDCDDCHITAEDAAYISWMDPAVALVVADLLDLHARIAEHAAARGYRTMDQTAAAVAVAAAFLREDTTEGS